jgi:catechol 2,3-dioxygenase-like lactoylglutathione lyase family enzyme
MFSGKLHHIGIIVHEEERVSELAEVFGLKLGRTQYVEEYEALCIFTEGALGVIEFIVPKGPKLAKFNKGMGGLHHIAIQVDDLAQVTDELKAKDMQLLEQTPVDAGPILINFLPPAYTRGITVEYIQPKSS